MSTQSKEPVREFTRKGRFMLPALVTGLVALLTWSAPTSAVAALDFGDAPAPYATLLANNGPSHTLGGPILGSLVDAESNGQPNPTATGDDLVLVDDEDGVVAITPLVAGQAASITVAVSGAAKVDAWIDYNDNGIFDHPSEHLGGGTSFSVVPGANVLNFTVPANATPGASFGRLRISTAGNLPPTGSAADGEVEDHAVVLLTTGSIHGFKFEDVDADGVYNSAVDLPLRGVPFALTGTDILGNAVSTSVSTDVNGWLGFEDVVPGSYTVTETVPAGYVATTPTAYIVPALLTGQELVAFAGQAMLVPADPQFEVVVGAALMFGSTVPGSIHGFKFEDVDADGDYSSADDLPLAGVIFRLTGTDGQGNVVTVAETSDANGKYRFTGLLPSVAGVGPATGYTVTEAVPTGFLATTPTAYTTDLLSRQQLVAFRDQAMLPAPVSTTIGFDDLDASGGPITGTALAGYLNEFGITLSNITPGGLGEIVDDRVGFAGNVLRAFSDFNVFWHDSPNAPYSYTLNFAVQQTNFSFIRPELFAATPSGLVVAPWQVEAFSSGGLLVDTNSEPQLAFFGSTPAVPFALSAPGFSAVTFSRTNLNTVAGLNRVPTDDWVVDVPADARREVIVGDALMFGNTVVGSIHGFKFEDVDGDGVYSNAVDLPLAGVTITLTGTDGQGNVVNTSVATDSNGLYGFTGLLASVEDAGPATGYSIAETVPAGSVATTPTVFITDLRSRQELVALPGQSALPPGAPQVELLLGAPLMFGHLVRGSIHGFTFEDVDGDGVYNNAIDLPLAGVRFTLTGTDGQGNVVSTTQSTDTNGLFGFTGLLPSVNGVGPATGYTVTETVSAGFVAMTPIAYTTDLRSRQELVVQAGQAALPPGDPRVEVVVGDVLRFGNTLPGSIHGFAYSDADGDGLYNVAVDTPFGGVTFTLIGTDGQGNVLNTNVSTDANGAFAFTGLLPSLAGTGPATGYLVGETVPAGYVLTTPLAYIGNLLSRQELVAWTGQALLPPGAERVEVLVGVPLTFGNAPSDFGDAPDLYQTTLASDGARHVVFGPLLGSLREGEPDARAPLDGTGDDGTGADDEDGVSFPSPLVAGSTTTVSVTASSAGVLDYFFDFDGDGTFGSLADEVFSIAHAGGTQSVPVAVPADAVPGNSYARFRFSTAGGLGASGAAPDGEVEDYTVYLVSGQTPLLVTSVFPAHATPDAARDTLVVVNFDESTRSETVNAETFKVWGKQTGFYTGVYSTAVATFNGARDFKPGEEIVVMLNRGVVSTLGKILYPYQSEFIVGADGVANFTLSYRARVLSNQTIRGLAVGDLDGDLDLDVFVSNAGQANRVLLNSGSGQFTDSGQSLGAGDSRKVALGDLDEDGDLDAFVANSGSSPNNKVWLNDGTGTFTESAQTMTGAPTRGVALGDLDGDGDLDAFLANEAASPNTVWFNDGSASFVYSGQSLQTNTSFDVALGDLDGDGDLDAVVVNAEPDTVWFNNGLGTFVESAQTLVLGGGTSAGLALGDLDADGDLDVVIVGTGTNSVWLNDGSGTGFTGTAIAGSVAGRDVSLNDIDGDGDLDALIVKATPPSQVLLNDGSGHLVDSLATAGGLPGSGESLAVGDVDGDGDLDALVAGASVALYINQPIPAFGGAAWPIPGIVQFEDFDSGGQGVAYRDGTAGNAGGQYRPDESVDIYAVGTAQNGYWVGHARAGEWLNYTINVQTAGSYTVSARVSAPGTGGTFHLEVSGSDISGPMTVPGTGGYYNWTLVAATGVGLSTGHQVLTVVMDSGGTGGAIGVLDSLTFTYESPVATTTSTSSTSTTSSTTTTSSTSTVGTTTVPTTSSTTTTLSGGSPYGGVPWTIPGTVQFENFDNGGQGIAYQDGTPANVGGKYRVSEAVDIYAAASAQNGHWVGYARAGEWMNYTINVQTGANYTVSARVSLPGAGGTFHLEVGGSDISGPMTVPGTGGYFNWTLVAASGVSLSAGEQVLTVVMDSGGTGGAVGVLDSLTFTREPDGGGGGSLFSLDDAQPSGPGPRPVDVQTSGGQPPHTDGWLTVDGDEETFWAGAPGAGGWWISLSYGSNIPVSSSDVVRGENSTTGLTVLGSADAVEWFDLQSELDLTNPVPVGYLWFVLPAESNGLLPVVHEIDVR